MFISLPQYLFSLYLGGLLIFWFLLHLSGLKTDFWNYLYSFAFSLMPLLGGLFGIYIAKPWGFLKSFIGKAIFYISLGLFTWGAGSMVWSYYNFFQKVAAPYPSLADIGFILSLPFWTIGIVNLSYATGARVNLKHNKRRALLIFIPVIVIIVSYYLLVVVARGGIITSSFDDYLKLFFDLAYPIGDIVILSLALVVFGLSLNFLGGRYKLTIFAILIGFSLMYVADFIFSYTTTIGSFYNGDFGDLMFTLALFTITFGIFGFYSLPRN